MVRPAALTVSSLDRTLLPPALHEFAVITDTHHVAEGVAHAQEFPSRLRQNERAERSLALAARSGVAFTLHLGDHIQDYPGSDTFDQTLASAVSQLNTTGPPMHHIAGNTDIGDKPDPTSPGPCVTDDSLDRYHDAFGRSWYSFDSGPLHFIVLNSSILNSDLVAATEQEYWLDIDLAAHRDSRIVLCLHYPLFLRSELDPGLGHYDTIAEPARSSLVRRITEFGIELILSGHSHFQFFNRIGNARFCVLPSTSFTRPGFSELFSSPPPAEHGRDDVAKLGFHIVRVHESDIRLHFVRTCDRPSMTAEEEQVVTCVSRDIPLSPLGVTLRHPLATYADVPVAFPSAVRQPVRNDYPLLGLVELGVGHVSVPVDDLQKPDQRERLAVLCHEGIAVTAESLWDPNAVPDLGRWVSDPRSPVDTLNVLIPPNLALADALPQVHAATTNAEIEVGLTPLLFEDNIPGRELPRSRRGYRPDDLPGLDDELGRLGASADRVAVRVVSSADLDRLTPTNFDHIGRVDVLVGLPASSMQSTATLVAEATLWVAAHPGCRMFLDPLLVHDRTLDETSGLLDRLCNPTPIFHLVRCLNSVIFGSKESLVIHKREIIRGLRITRACRTTQTLTLLTADPANRPSSSALEAQTPYLSTMARGYRLLNATSTSTSGPIERWLANGEPVLLVSSADPDHRCRAHAHSVSSSENRAASRAICLAAS